MDPIRCERNFIKDTINKTEIETDTIAERYRFFFVQGIVTRIMKENRMPQDKIKWAQESEWTIMDGINTDLNALWHTLEMQYTEEELMGAVTVRCGNCRKYYPRGSNGNIIYPEEAEGITMEEKAYQYNKLKQECSCPHRENPCQENPYLIVLCADYEFINTHE